MRKDDALALIDGHKNRLVDPVEMLKLTWLRVVVAQIPDDAWALFLSRAERVLSN